MNVSESIIAAVTHTVVMPRDENGDPFHNERGDL